MVDPPLAAPPPPTSADFDNTTLVDVKIVDAKAEETKPVDAKAAELKPADAKTDWEAMPIRELRTRAEGNEILAMEELARRLLQGVGVTKDAQAGAGWLLRAAQGGSAQAAFNVGVMYERGFVVERDSAKAIEWYRKAVDADMPMAKHNLALLLRDGKGAARNGKEAVELLRSATRQGMVASMFTLGDIYERGDAAPKDQATALAWFTIASELDRQMNKGEETPLSKTSGQRAQTLQRLLTPGELERAQQVGQDEFKQIVEALQPPKPASLPQSSGLAPAVPQIANVDPPGWPQAANEQVRATQQVLFDLKLLRDPPDGAIGPMTRTAILYLSEGCGDARDRRAQQGIVRRDAHGAGQPRRRRQLAVAASAESRDQDRREGAGSRGRTQGCPGSNSKPASSISASPSHRRHPRPRSMSCGRHCQPMRPGRRRQ